MYSVILDRRQIHTSPGIPDSYFAVAYTKGNATATRRGCDLVARDPLVDTFLILLKYAPGGSTLEMGELAKSGYAAFVLVIGGFAAYELEL
jgi:hypothetical protein